jgi:MFS family permease
MLASYFPDKNYNLLYLHVFGDRIGNRLLELFTGVFFYYLGMPLPFILLFFGLEFGLRGALCPLAPVLASRIGVRKTMALSYLFLLVFFFVVYLSHVSLILGFFSFIFQAISRGMYYPCVDTLHSVLVRNGTRGKQYTLEIVWTIVAGAIAVGIGSEVLLSAFVPAAIAIAVVLALAVIPVFFMDALDFSSEITFVSAYKYLASLEWRENLLPIGAESLAIIANVIVAPVFIFTLVKTSSSFSSVILIGLLIEAVAVLIYGRMIDARGNKRTLGAASLIQTVGNIGYASAALLTSFLPFINGFNNIAWDLFSSNFNTRIQQKAHKYSHPLLFNTASQMTLCFVEIVVLSIFALIAWYFGTAAFVIIFASSIVGLVVSTRYFVD